MNKPFARVEKYSDMETLAWRLRVGEFYGVPCYEREAEIKAKEINAAHRAEVRRELEAFKRRCVEMIGEWKNSKVASAILEEIEVFNIDAFIERKEKK